MYQSFEGNHHDRYKLMPNILRAQDLNVISKYLVGRRINVYRTVWAYAYFNVSLNKLGHVKPKQDRWASEAS